MLVMLLVGGGSNAWGDTAEELPYNYGFNTANITSDGWTMTDCKTSSLPTGTASYPTPKEGTYMFRFYYHSSAQYIITPKLQTSSTGVEVSLYYNVNSTGSSQTRTFSIAYSTTDTQISSFSSFVDYNVTENDALWHQWTASINNTEIKYIAIKYNNNSYSFYIDDFSVTAQEQYKTPKDLVVNSTSSSSATLSWTNGRDETAWQIAYSTKENFTPATEGTRVYFTEDNLSDDSFTLEGLTEGVTYYAYIRSYYGSKDDNPLDEGKFSNWSSVKAEFTPFAYFTINDGNSPSYYIPVYGYKANYLFKSQFIIPKASLENLKGKKIIELTFYASQSSADWGNAKFDVYLNEVDNTTYASTPVFESWGTKVLSNKKLSISENKMVVTFDEATPYPYNGGNLMIGFDLITAGSSVTSSWYGVSATQNACYEYWASSSYSTTRSGSLPKVTFKTVSPTVSVTLGTNGYATYACPRPLDLSNLPSGLKAYKAAIDAKNSKVRFTEINQTIQANTGVLLEGTAGQTYAIPVAESGTALDGNDFLVNSTGGTFTADDGYTYFGMKKATSASDALVFATFAPGSVAIPTDKAYLKVLTSSLPATSRQLVCSFDDETPTGISATQNDREKTINDEFIYNLNGQRVNKPSKGLYIVNGKKVIIK